MISYLHGFSNLKIPFVSAKFELRMVKAQNWLVLAQKHGQLGYWPGTGEIFQKFEF